MPPCRHILPVVSPENPGTRSTSLSATKSSTVTMDEKKVASEATVLSTSDVSDGEIESQGFDVKETKKLLRRLDWHIIPFMSLIYL